MSAEPFKAASEAAESWLNTVALVAYLGKLGSVDPAFRCLMPVSGQAGNVPNLHDSFHQHASTLYTARDQLAALSDGPVKWEAGRGLSAVRDPQHTYPHCWSSAHEAAHGIALVALELLVWPLEGITDPTEQWELARRLLADRWKALVIPVDEVAALQERVRRERAKLLAQPTELAPKKRGRPAKGETDNDSLVIAALSAHHRYTEGGSVGNYEPASVRKLAKEHDGLTTAAVSRFLERQFSKPAHKRYCEACRKDTIGLKLALWRREPPERLASLRPEEEGRGEDD